MLKKFAAGIAGMAIAAVGVAAVAANISGAGATFPAPVYQKWAEAYKAATGNQLNYQAIGSGGGIKQIEANTVDFGASDKPLKPDDLAANGLQQFPTVDRRRRAGGEPAGHRAGPDQAHRRPAGRHLSRRASPTGTTRTIDRAQPGREAAARADHRRPPLGRLGHHLPLHQLPDDDGPGLGQGRRRQRLGRTGRPASAARATTASPPSCKQTAGAIGYVEYAYAKQNHMTYALMQNKAGHWVAPTAAELRRRRRRRQVDAGAGLLPAAARPAGRQRLADHRRDLHPDAHQADQRRRPATTCWPSSTGPTRTATPPPQRSTTCRCRTPVKALIRKSWTSIVGPNGKPVYP